MGEADDAFHGVRGRSATLARKEKRLLCNLLFVVAPQDAGCG
jgi:hypothetical protein